MPSKKELILAALETRVKQIITGNTIPGSANVYENTVSYVDRQFVNITANELDTKEMPWIIINNEGEEFSGNPGSWFENTILAQIVGFVKATEDSPNLDTMMNSLQRDILLGLLSDITLGSTCDFILPRGIITVPEMIWPYGGFILTLDITYIMNKSLL